MLRTFWNRSYMPVSKKFNRIKVARKSFAFFIVEFSDYNLNLICEEKCYSELIKCALTCDEDSDCLRACAHEEGHCIQGLKQGFLVKQY